MLISFQLLAFRQVFGHLRIRKPLAISAIIPHRQRNEVIPNNATDIQIVMQVTQSLIMKKFMFRVSHGVSSIKSLTPVKWVGRHVTLRLRLNCLPTGIESIPQFGLKVKCFFDALVLSKRAVFPPKPKGLGFQTV